jgi:DNA-binding LacI/PurR family transcriptional regulator
MSITKDTSDYKYLRRLEEYNIPIVFFDRIPTMNNIHYVACDLQLGMLETINKLVGFGHRRIGFINGPLQLLASNERQEAYLKGLTENQIDICTDIIVSSDLSSGNNYEAMNKLLSLKDRPSAVITFNDYVALDAMKLVKQNGLLVNKDICFASFVNLPIWSYMDTPPLISIEQFPYEQGTKATEIFFRLLKERSKPGSQFPSFYNTLVRPRLVYQKSESTIV